MESIIVPRRTKSEEVNAGRRRRSITKITGMSTSSCRRPIDPIPMIMATNDGPTFDYSEITARNVNLIRRYYSPKPIVPLGTVSARVKALEKDSAHSQEDVHLDSLSKSPSSESEEDELMAMIPKILPRSHWESLSIPPIFSPRPKTKHMVQKANLKLNAIADKMARTEAEKLAIASMKVIDIPKKSRIWPRSSKTANNNADKEALEEPDSSDFRHNIGQYFVERGFHSDDVPVALNLRGSKSFDDALTETDSPQASPNALKRNDYDRSETEGSTYSYSSTETDPYVAGKLSVTPNAVPKPRSIHSIGEPIHNVISHTASSVRLRAPSNSMKPKRRSSQNSRHHHDGPYPNEETIDNSQEHHKYARKGHKRAHTIQNVSTLPNPLKSDPSRKSKIINSYHSFPSPPSMSKSGSRWKRLLKSSVHALSGFRGHDSKAGNTHDKFGFLEDHRGDPHEALKAARDDWYEPNNRLASPLLAAAKRQFRASTDSFSEGKTKLEAEKDKGKTRASTLPRNKNVPAQKSTDKNRHHIQHKDRPKHRHRLSLFHRKRPSTVEYYDDVDRNESGRSGDLKTLRRDQEIGVRPSYWDDREMPARALTPWTGLRH